MKAITLNLLLPIPAAILLFWLRGDMAGNVDLGSSYLLFAGAALVLQALAGLILRREEPGAWKLGNLCLWLASAAFMGGFSAVYLKTKAVESIAYETKKVELFEKLGKGEGPGIEAVPLPFKEGQRGVLQQAASMLKDRLASDSVRIEELQNTLAKTEGGPDPAQRQQLEEELREAIHLSPDLSEMIGEYVSQGHELLIYLQYLMSLLFLSSFYSIAAFASHAAQKRYGVLDPDLEDVLPTKGNGAMPPRADGVAG